MVELDLDPAWRESLARILAIHAATWEVWAFGSRVQGRSRPWSDLDLVLVGDEPVPEVALGELREALACSDLPIRVDVADWLGLTPAFRERVRQDHVVLRSAH
jgi:predicted nucleotidyltransferase